MQSRIQDVSDIHCQLVSDWSTGADCSSRHIPGAICAMTASSQSKTLSAKALSCKGAVKNENFRSPSRRKENFGAGPAEIPGIKFLE
jgi:hypothetical protein